MCHGQFVPPAIAPHTVHGVYDFYRRDVFIKQQVTIIRCAHLPLLIIGAGPVINVRYLTICQYKCALEVFDLDFAINVLQQVLKRRFAVIKCYEIKEIKYPCI